MIAFTNPMPAASEVVYQPAGIQSQTLSAPDSQSPLMLLLKRFRETLLHIQQSELSRYRKKLSDAEYALLEVMAEQMMQRIAVHPASQLLAAGEQGDAGMTAETFACLFRLTQDEK